MNKLKDGVISIFNIITYAVLGLFLLYFFTSMNKQYGNAGIISWAGALFVLLLMSLIIGFVLSQLFPDRRSKQFHFLFNAIEAVCILIITLAGIEFSEKLFFSMAPVDESKIVKLGNVLTKSTEIFAKEPVVTTVLINRPSVYAATRLFSLLFNIAGFTDMTVNYVFLVVHLLTAFFSYRIARMLSGRVTSIAVYALMMIMPSQLYGTMVRNGDMFGCMFITLHLYLFLVSRRYARMEKPNYFIRIFLVASAVACSIGMFFNPAVVLLPVSEVFYILALQRNRSGKNPEILKDRIINSVIISMVPYVLLFILLILKAQHIDKDLGSVISGFFSAYIPNASINQNLMHVWSDENLIIRNLSRNTMLATQVIYGSMLGLSMICNIISWIIHEKEHFIIQFYFLSTVLITYLSGKNSYDHSTAYFALAIMTGALFETIYSALRSKAFEKYKKQNSRLADSSLSIESEHENITADNKTEKHNESEVITVSHILNIDADKVTNEYRETDPSEFLDNPLPLPKKKENKAMDFDIETKIDDNFDI